MKKKALFDTKILIIAVNVIMMYVLVGCGAKHTSVQGEYQQDFTGHISEEAISESYEVATEEYVYVHLCGAVVNPGVYKVASDTRVYEVVDMAGGITEEANVQAVNMAKPVEDEMQIYIPMAGEVFNGENTQYYQETQEKLLNINQATKEELMELPGIGEAKAEAIIAYREENGLFTDITDIMNISGIKESAFSKIKDKIKV